MAANTNKGFGLLFEMGCGKTRTAIAIAGAAYEKGAIQRVLVIAPTSVVSVWPKEIAEVADFKVTCKALLGTKQQRIRMIEDLQMQLKNAAGEDVFGVKGYEQRLPEITDDEEDQSQFFPYFIVRIEEGNTPTDDEPWLVGTTVLFGICDYDKETNGHRTILEMITKVTNRFLERPLLDSKFRANQNVSFALQDEDTYPFYFGAIDIKFYVPKIGRSDDWS